MNLNFLLKLRTHFLCKKLDIKNYTINKNGTVDVNGDVNISNRDLTKIPIKFNIVYGNFDCSFNKLETLFGSPKIIEGNFICSYNSLKNLKYSPSFIGKDFNCTSNNLISLYNINKIKGNFICYNNPVYEIWKLFKDKDKIEELNKLNVIRKNNIFMYSLEEFFNNIGIKADEYDFEAFKKDYVLI